MEKANDLFNELYNQNKSKDIEIVKNILDIVKKYNVYDIIARLSALNLVPENQNKATIIEPIVAAILTLPKKEIKSEIIMSAGKFKKIINLIEQMDLKQAIDPPENPFIERVLFYDNYNVFTGINYIPAYILQIFIKALCFNTEKFNKEFLEKSNLLINFILQISNQMTQKIGIDIDSLKKFDEREELLVPNGEKLEKLKETLVIKETIINSMLKYNELIEFLYTDFNSGEIEETLNTENQKFYSKPFLKNEKGDVIVLSPSILVPFLVHSIIKLSDKYGEKEQIIELYNNITWRECQSYFDKLGNKKLNTNCFDIELIENVDFYKEALLCGDNKQICIAIGLFDDGRDFNGEIIFDTYKNYEFKDLLKRRIKYFIKELKKYVKEENIFFCLIYNSFGRSMLVEYNEKTANTPICLNPFELKCISINEIEKNFFLTRYIESKNELINTPQAFGELPYIQVYTECDYSFYVNDDVDTKDALLFLTAGDHIRYIVKAIKKENRMLVDSYKNGYMEEVILQDEKRKIYLKDKIDKNNLVVSLLVNFDKTNIWIYSDVIKSIKEINIYRSMVDVISYWLAECRDIIENIEDIESHINIKICINGAAEEYFCAKEYLGDIKNTISINQERNEIILKITPETYHCFNRCENIKEKELILILLENITNSSNINYSKINKVFLPLEKQKFFVMDYETYPYLKPVSFPQKREISENDVNKLLDCSGAYIQSLKKWGYGIVKEEDKNEITLLMVEYLYNLLKEKVKKINPHNLIEAIYIDLEEKIYYMMLFQKRHYRDTLCYPEKKIEMWKDFNEMQRSAKAMKFLIEYIAAQPPAGKEKLGESEYEELLAICSLIIEWAYNNDLFRFKIFNSTPIEILKSNRIGIKKEAYDNMGKSMSYARMKEFEYNSIGKWKDLFVENKFDIEELNNAFFYENGFGFTEFVNVCNNIILIGDEQTSDVKKIECKVLIAKLKDNLKEVNEEKIENILDYISLEKREDFMTPPKGYRKEDVYPWRFNRELSFTRKPLIKRNKEYIWGNRNLFHMLMFTIDIISEGKFKTKSKQMNKYIGSMSKKRGQAFNESVFNILKQFPELIVDKNLKKINKKKIADEEKKDLGDIDILYIYKEKKQIVVGEVKDFKLSKNPYEIYCEYREMFEDTENKKSYNTKLKRRANWVEKHIEDVKCHYGLLGEGWKVYKTFIVNEHLVSNNVYEKNENIIAISEITLDSLTNLR